MSKFLTDTWNQAAAEMDSFFEGMDQRLAKAQEMTLAEALEAALDGKATREDVIAAIDAELKADPEPFDMVEGEGAGQYTFDTPKDSQLAMF